jgi:hypothetical protein
VTIGTTRNSALPVQVKPDFASPLAAAYVAFSLVCLAVTGVVHRRPGAGLEGG